MPGTPKPYPESNAPVSANMPPIETALAELDSLSSYGRFTYTDVAKRHGVERSTLRRRHQAITEPCTVKVMKQQQLTPEQELELFS